MAEYTPNSVPVKLDEYQMAGLDFPAAAEDEHDEAKAAEEEHQITVFSLFGGPKTACIAREMIPNRPRTGYTAGGQRYTVCHQG